MLEGSNHLENKTLHTGLSLAVPFTALLPEIVTWPSRDLTISQDVQTSAACAA